MGSDQECAVGQDRRAAKRWNETWNVAQALEDVHQGRAFLERGDEDRQWWGRDHAISCYRRRDAWDGKCVAALRFC